MVEYGSIVCKFWFEGSDRDIEFCNSVSLFDTVDEARERLKRCLANKDLLLLEFAGCGWHWVRGEGWSRCKWLKR